MDSDNVLIHQLINPCCAALKEKCSKIESARKDLRKGIKMQEGVINKLEKENLALKKAFEEEKVRVDTERQDQAKESAIRESLDKEIDDLKSEIHTLRQREGSTSQAKEVDSELLLLRTQHAEMEAEIAKLRELVEEGNVSACLERQEKSKESANRELLEKEIDLLKSEIQSFQLKEVSKSSVQEVELETEIDNLKELLKQEKLRADSEMLEKSKESATRVSLEKEVDILKAEVHSLHLREGSESKAENDELLLLRTRHAEMEAEVDKLKKLAEKERKKADREKKKAEAEKSKESVKRELLEKEIDVLKSEINSFQLKEGLKSRVQDSELETEIDKLKELLEQEKLRADAETLEKSKESAARVSLEKEIGVLKAEIHLLNQREGSDSKAEDDELLLLKTHHTELEAEVDKLKKLAEKERKKADRLNKKADAEKSKESAKRELLEKEIDALKSEVHSFQQKEGSKSRVQNVELETEIDRLKELLKQEKLRADAETLEKSKESATRVSLEKQIDVLKAEIHSLHQKEGLESKAEHDELLLLRTRYAEMEAEVDKLKKLAEKERKKADRAKKKADAEKISATKANETLKAEKSRIDVEQELMTAEKRKVEESRIELEKLKSEAEEARSKLLAEADKKLKLEKCKLLDEKRRVDVEMGKVEKQKQLVGMYQKKAMDEKSRADHLSQQLEEQKNKIQNLQKHRDLETNRAERLEKLVKINEHKALEEKQRADHLARQLEDHVEKIDRLQKELSILASSRSSLEAPLPLPGRNTGSEIAELEMMKKHLKLKTRQVKHAKEVAKLERDRKDMLQQKLGSITHEFVQFLQRINVLDDYFAPRNEGRDKSNKKIVFDSLGSNLRGDLLSKFPNEVHFHPDNVPANCNASLLPAGEGNSTRCVSGIDFKMDNLLRCSERKMLESSAINSTMASFSDRPLMATQGKGALTVTTSANIPEENLNLQSKVPAVEISSQNPAEYDCIKNVENSKKRKSIIDAGKSVEHLYSEGKKWQMRVEGQLSEVHSMLKSQMDKALLGKSNMEQLHPEQSRVKKRRKKLAAEEVAVQLYDASNNHKERIGDGRTEVANVCNKIIVPGKEISIAAYSRENRAGDFCKESREMECVLDVIQGNYMKLLELDDNAEEERYCRAVEKPMSPFVPVPELQINEIHHNPLSFGKDNLVCVAEDVANSKNCEESTVYDNTPAHRIQESEEVAVFSDLCRSNDNLTRISCPSSSGVPFARPPKYCVVSSDNEHESSIARIYRAIKMSLSQCSKTFEMDEAIIKCMLASLKMEDVSPHERASVIFSILLNLSEPTLEVWNSLQIDAIQVVESFVRCLLKDAEVQTYFAELCFSNELLALIEEFLIDRRVLVLTDVASESSPITDFRVNVLLNDEDITLSRTLATRYQLLPGSAILASVCATTNRIGFLCEASQNILRMHKPDNLVLDILHVFAYVCGPKYFAVKDYTLSMTVTRSLVTLLEQKNASRAYACCPLYDVVAQRKFPLCTRCPFSEGAVSVDEAICLLLEKLQNYASSDAINNPGLPVNHESSTQQLETYNSCPSKCSANCCLTKFVITCQSSPTCDGKFCHCTDVISLLELVASNMQWDWTCNNIIPPILKLLDSFVPGDFFTIFIAFLGKLGRLGVDANGYDDKGVESLRSYLSALLFQNSFNQLAFTTQIAVLYALGGIVPLNLEKLVKTNAEIPLIDKYLDFGNFFRNWYSMLSSEQESLVLEFLESRDLNSRAVL